MDKDITDILKDLNLPQGEELEESFKKYTLQNTDTYLVFKFKLGDNIPVEEFTEEFAQSQLKALHFLNSAFRKRLELTLGNTDKAEREHELLSRLDSLKIPLLCSTVERQIGLMLKIMERGQKLGYSLKLHLNFTAEELDAIEEDRVFELHGWEKDNEL